jgi:very-short-patch-repair endonuclease
MKHVLLFILMLSAVMLPATNLNAQKTTNDSILSVIKNEKEDTNKILHILSLADGLYVKDEYSITDSLDRVALALSEKLDFKKGSVKAYGLLGKIFISQGNYAEALKYLNHAMDISKEIGYIKGIATALGSIGNIYYNQGKYPDALKNYIESEKLYEKMKDDRGMGAELGNIGLINYEQENYTEAVKNQLQGIVMDSLAGNVFARENAYGNIGNVYYAQRKFDDALRYYTRSLAISKEIGDIQGSALMYEGMGVICQDQGKYNDAYKYFCEDMKIVKQIGDKMGIANSYQYSGRVLTKLKRYAEAKNDIDSAILLAKEINNKPTLSNAYAGRMYIDTANSDYKAAFADYKYYIIYRDSLVNEENTKKIVSEQMNYEFDKKQAEQKAEQDKKDAIAAADKKKQNVITIMVAIGLALVLVFSGLLFSRFRVTQRQKVIIERQKAIVEEKNKEVTDSITYAKRLQDAILPPLKLVKQYLPESFLLYKPKDIVAGDFYWMEVAPSLPSPLGKESAEPEYFTADPALYASLKTKADAFRNQPTEAEKIAWQLLKDNATGFHIRRQHIIGQFIADLVNIKTKVVIEIDGDVHDYQKEEDAIRTHWLEKKGFEVIRFRNEEVIGSPDSFFNKVRKKLQEREQKVLPNGEDLGGAGTIYIAAADCTGHGVPGAMVSVVCSNALNRTVKEFKITETGKILDKVRELVLETFEKSESNVQDGMDISLLAISRKSLVDSIEVQWSGAFNSLWYIQNGEMKEVPADKQPIGKTDKPLPFSTHNLKLQKGYTLYLLTDGYADQFGGIKGKKFKYKQLEELLVANCSKSMDEQKSILNETIENWKGSLEQVDDILIIGIRIS